MLRPDANTGAQPYAHALCNSGTHGDYRPNVNASSNCHAGTCDDQHSGSHP